MIYLTGSPRTRSNEYDTARAANSIFFPNSLKQTCFELPLHGSRFGRYWDGPFLVLLPLIPFILALPFFIPFVNY